MALDDLHEDGTARVLSELARRPQPVAPTSPKFSAWSTLTAAPRGVAGGASEAGGFWADIIGAFGQVAGAYPETLGVNPDPAQRKQADEQRTKLLEQGVDYSSEAGDMLRSVARDHYAPDPLTAHAAEQTIYGLTRFASKAVGYSMAGGPAAGAVLTGADEAMTASDELRLKGVDLATRTQAGAVAGVAAAAGVALPVAGKTAVQTAALVALGGPASFMAQQATTRGILKAANYDHLADQYDPLDPVGLAVSTLVPAGFGAWAMRGAARAKAVPPPTEHVDAARVALAVEDRAARNIGDDSIATRQAHEAAAVRAEQQIAAGERVEVADVAPLVDAAPSVRLESLQRAVDAAPPLAPESVRWYHGGSPEEVSGRLWFTADARDAIGWASRGESMSVWYVDVKKGSAGVDWGEPGLGVIMPTRQELPPEIASRRQKLIDPSSPTSEPQVSVVTAPGDRLQSFAQTIAREVRKVEKEMRAAEPAPRALPEPAPAKERPPANQTAAAVRAALDQAESGKPIEGEANPLLSNARAGVKEAGGDKGKLAAIRGHAEAMAEAAPNRPPADIMADAIEAMRAGKPVPGSDPAVSTPKDAVQAEQMAVAQRIAEVQQAYPDLEVMLDGMDKPMRLADVLDAAQREADEMNADAPLYQIAAMCALTNGI